MRASSSPAGPPWSPVPPAASARRWRTGWPGAAATWCCSTGTPTGSTRSPPRSAPRTPTAGSTPTWSTWPTRRHRRGWPRRSAGRHPRIRLLVNNAGVALGGRFDQVTLEEFSWVVDINFRAVVQLTHALLPALKAEPGAHLVNVSSLFGLIAPAGQAAYSASKFAVRGFTEALRHELVEDGIGVTSVHPGGIGPGSRRRPGRQRRRPRGVRGRPPTVREAALHRPGAGRRGDPARGRTPPRPGADRLVGEAAGPAGPGRCPPRTTGCWPPASTEPAGGPAARSTSRLEPAPAADSVPTPRPAVDPLTPEATPGQPA